MKIHKQSLDVFEGEEHQLTRDGETSTEHYSYVFFHEQEHTYRHFKTFDTYKEAYAFMLKMFLSSDPHGMININEKHWIFVENELQTNTSFDV